ncbi:hypothetical protein L0664_07445 [Octadecabacter sp. G9-8]|uniref:PH domain-containing protein n=1 Tax=Octadecabacter dasysiphoniae TaxID=2909341 RepID=A0ABS9CUI7_9RHOB|nr:hypothetical protein [Octadecabacter dasysiphoniae]MCF2870897.1 hypothetical protein [Octadecabacter dasysiphoniae]
MATLTLYPSDLNKKLSVLQGVGALALGGYLVFLNGDLQFNIFGYLVMAIGVWTGMRSVFQFFNPRPVFEADAHGFSVKGKTKRPWSEFRGVTVHKSSGGLVSLTKMIRVRVGKSILGGYVQINHLQMSEPALTMARRIEEFAASITRDGATVVDKYPVPRVEENVRPTAPEPAVQRRPPGLRPQDFGAGPVQSPPTFGERIFGRRKVI